MLNASRFRHPADRAVGPWQVGGAGAIATLIVALFFFAGIQIFFMGLLGEYILAIYGQVRKKPMVIERERINFPPE
ncbi:MAG: hypothetical protein U1E93_08500 [Alphaproteobacteria bacterium]